METETTQVLIKCSCGINHVGFNQLQFIGTMGDEAFMLYLFNCRACGSTSSIQGDHYKEFLVTNTVKGSL